MMIDPKASVPLRIAAIYAGLGLAYIFASDWIVESGISAGWTPSVQTLKGAAFVLVTAALIGWLVRHELRRYRRLEQAFVSAQRMEAVAQMTGGLAHDFNNLLMAILGNLDLIEMESPTSEQTRRRLRNAGLAIERGTSLTRRMLALSRNQILAPILVDPNKALREMLPLLTTALGEKVDVRLQLAQEVPPVRVDPGQLESAILNLTVNARDAMPQGGSLMLSSEVSEISARSSDRSGLERLPAGRYVVIAASDDGIGMSRAVLDRLFEPFFTTKPDGKGTGLGLVMVQSFARQAGGEALVSSLEGRGTTVQLFLPAAESALPVAEGPQPPRALQAAGEPVLLVENDISVREVMAAYLVDLGYRVRTADRVREALAVLGEAPEIKLLITDIILGGERTGIDLAREVRRRSPDTAILLVSGYADPTITGQLADFAQVGWIANPVRLDVLGRAVREALVP